VETYNYCDTGFSSLSSCKLHWASSTASQARPASDPSSTDRWDWSKTDVISADVTSWAVADCPENAIARRLLCASVTTHARAASDDLATGLPRPKPWVITTGKDSLSIRALHLETLLELAATLDFYRDALGKRGWTEKDGAVVAPDGANIAFTAPDGPALLRLTRQNARTIVDLSVRKAAAPNAALLPKSGQVKLLLENTEDEGAVITIDERAIKLSAHTEHDLTNNPETAGTLPDRTAIDLPPGKYKVSFKVASGAITSREFEAVADETWGLLVGPAGVPLTVQLN
jgi:hypothetical protein